MWWCSDCSRTTATLIILPILLFDFCFTATVKDIFNLDTNKLIRLPRDEKRYSDRYGGNVASESVLNTRTIKPEDDTDPRDPGANLGKRCIRCGDRYPSYYDPYDYRGGGGGGYEDRGYYNRDRYDDRYDDLRDRYSDRRYDPYERYYDRYDRDRYDRYDRYDQRRDYDRDRDRMYDRGIGYDNRGYDYRDYRDRERDRGGYRDRDRDYYRPSYYDDRDDMSSRGYGGRPYTGYWGGGYASGWNYGRDDYRDRYDDRRHRDPYDGYRPTSYLYGRPSTAPISNTTPQSNNSGATESPASG